MVNDVKKRWNDPPMLRHATRYVLAVLGLAALGVVVTVVWASARPRCLEAASMLCDGTSRAVVGLVPGGILLAGGIGALVLAFRAWRAERAWPIWQGVGWLLFTLMVVYLSVVGTQ
ncbi:hypothetical protein [Nocardia seriolae]|uniref:Transmembrane protein n=1 Tax=Nocardia seriolae TaxID=37332 RepID=A0A0B8NNN6_9NOCA|nr:hypothetical protein [Nocardia seriolae]APA99502.1 hypothetical protein NS506_05456 [Nocardia seriolae]MTJ63118.1 hypothetical protein [Nocardia seriolae]MTJ73558.1 hypothetical protein [Nocardia seriolae]MTJ89075.1 hypothetical protein [Nocardia seriolae]MTK33054.1 hypothetical protein [Nocardia seriolae]